MMLIFSVEGAALVILWLAMMNLAKRQNQHAVALMLISRIIEYNTEVGPELSESQMRLRES